MGRRYPNPPCSVSRRLASPRGHHRPLDPLTDGLLKGGFHEDPRELCEAGPDSAFPINAMADGAVFDVQLTPAHGIASLRRRGPRGEPDQKEGPKHRCRLRYAHHLPSLPLAGRLGVVRSGSTTSSRLTAEIAD